MNKNFIPALLLFLAVGAKAQQKVINLYSGKAPGSELWTYTEKVNNSAGFPAVYNVSRPTLTAYLPDPAIATGTAVIVCPGGGFYILGMKGEGTEVANWLNKKGVAVFILKYRLGESTSDNPVQELGENMKKADFTEKIKPLIPLAVADGRRAIEYVRAHAPEYNILPDRIGIMGFSAGGTVAAGTAYNYTANNKPDFVAPIYAYIPPGFKSPLAADEPPIFLTVATDDQLGLVPGSIDLYNDWHAAKKDAELHVYEKGGHGFGMGKHNLPTDTWIERFGDWLGLEGFLKPADPK
jgi:acetyl esterase/lipase